MESLFLAYVNFEEVKESLLAAGCIRFISKNANKFIDTHM